MFRVLQAQAEIVPSSSHYEVFYLVVPHWLDLISSDHLIRRGVRAEGLRACRVQLPTPRSVASLWDRGEELPCLGHGIKPAWNTHLDRLLRTIMSWLDAFRCGGLSDQPKSYGSDDSRPATSRSPRHDEVKSVDIQEYHVAGQLDICYHAVQPPGTRCPGPPSARR